MLIGVACGDIASHSRNSFQLLCHPPPFNVLQKGSGDVEISFNGVVLFGKVHAVAVKEDIHLVPPVEHRFRQSYGEEGVLVFPVSGHRPRV